MLFELYEEFKDGCLDDILLEEATDIEALFIEDKIYKRDIVQNKLLAPRQALEAIF